MKKQITPCKDVLGKVKRMAARWFIIQSENTSVGDCSNRHGGNSPMCKLLDAWSLTYVSDALCNVGKLNANEFGRPSDATNEEDGAANAPWSFN